MSQACMQGSKNICYHRPREAWDDLKPDLETLRSFEIA